jgi:hypothetical protein
MLTAPPEKGVLHMGQSHFGENHSEELYRIQFYD